MVSENMDNKKKKIKRKIFFASIYEVGAIENFLEQEAAKGWMFVRCKGVFYVFEKCEPVRLKFQVDFFDEATIFDTRPEAKTLDYIEYCKESGWTHIFSSGKFQVFYSAEENPVPIQTDENQKLKLVSKATILTNGINWILLPIVWALTWGGMAVNNLLNPKHYFNYSEALTYVQGVANILFWLGIIIFGMINMTRFGIFYLRNRRRLKNGLGLEFYSVKSAKRFGLFHKIYLLLFTFMIMAIYAQDQSIFLYFLAGFVGMLLIMMIFSKLSYSKWANRDLNIAFTIIIPIFMVNAVIVGAVFLLFLRHDAKLTYGNTTYYYSKDSIDVTLSDLGFEKPDNFLYEETIHHKVGTLFAQSEEYTDRYMVEGDSCGYSIDKFSSKYESILNKYNKLLVEDPWYALKMLPDTTDSWHSDQVFLGKKGNSLMYVVFGEGVTLLIEGELNEEQAAKLSTYYIDKQIENNK